MLKKMSSFQEQLCKKKSELKETETILTAITGERFIEGTKTDGSNKKISPKSYGFVVDTKPDHKAACILRDFLYLGSQDSVNLENINDLGITHVLSVGIELDITTDIINLYLPCLDLPEYKLSNILPEAINFINLAKKDSGRVLVHCNAGVSRSAAVVISYLMLEEKYKFEDAHALVKSKRPSINLNKGFIYQLTSSTNE